MNSRPQNEAGGPRALIISLASLGYVSAAALALNVVLARTLDVAEMGHVRLVRAIVDLAAIPAGLGMGAVIAKHAADERAGAEALRRIVLNSMLACGLASAAAGIVLAAGLSVPGALNDEVAGRFARWMVGLLPGIALFECLKAYLQGTGQIRRLALAQAARSTVLLLSGAGLATAMGMNGWALGRAAAEFTALGLAGALLFRVRGARLDGSFARGALRFGAYAAMTQALAVLVTSIDVLCLDRIRGDPIELGHYGIATLMMNAALLAPGAFVQANFARFAAGAHDPARSWRNLWRYTGRLLVVLVPTCAFAYAAAPFITFVFGADYEPSVSIFRGLVFALFLRSSGNVASNLIIAAGLVRQTFAASLATAAVNLALNVSLIGRWGVQGAVAATGVSYAVRSGLSFVILYLYKIGRARPASGIAATTDSDELDDE